MNVLDENVPADQRRRLASWHLAVRHIGYTIERQGVQDDAIIPFLLTLHRPTFFTFDPHFYRRDLCHARFCLVYMDVSDKEMATCIRRLLHHPEFDTQVKRMGTVIHVSHVGISVWRLRAEQEKHVEWT